jgi:hypothetical protein
MSKVLWPTIVVVVVAVAIVALACEAELDPSLTELEVGDCVESRETGQIETLKHIDCSEPDALRVTSKFDMSGYSSWPGYPEVDRVAAERCPASTMNYLGPTEESWEEVGDREVICFERVD